MKWDETLLDAIVRDDDLRVAPFRDDGRTPGTPTWVWCVAVDGALYVRAYHGRRSRWLQAALRQKSGRIVAGGVTYAVTFVPVDGEINDAIDAAYAEKYHGSPYLAPMVSGSARDATMRIYPVGPTGLLP